MHSVNRFDKSEPYKLNTQLKFPKINPKIIIIVVVMSMTKNTNSFEY